jgi:putative redox protein
MTKLKAIYLGDLRTQCVHESGAVLETDAPKDNQGKGENFSPTDLFAVSLASCMLTLMGICARQLGLDLKGATAEVEKEMAARPPRRIGRIVVRIRSQLSPNPEERQKMEQMALACPVHASLHPDIRLEIDFVWGL